MKSTTPKPFVFVLMPFHKDFDDIYKFGIKDTAEEVGAYAERVDEQMYTVGILDRIYNQINKADVIVADMTGQNPNVFYEVGYAHALGKVVLLLTENANDIPFDLKHRPHIEYGGSIAELKKKLIERLRWGIAESKKQMHESIIGRYKVLVSRIHVPEISQITAMPLVQYSGSGASYGPSILTHHFSINVSIQNTSEAPQTISHISLFSGASKKLIPDYKSESVDLPQLLPSQLTNDSPTALNVRYRLDVNVPPLLPDSIEEFPLRFNLYSYERNKPPLLMEEEQPFILKMHSGTFNYIFPFRLKVQFEILSGA